MIEINRAAHHLHCQLDSQRQSESLTRPQNGSQASPYVKIVASSKQSPALPDFRTLLSFNDFLKKKSLIQAPAWETKKRDQILALCSRYRRNPPKRPVGKQKNNSKQGGT